MPSRLVIDFIVAGVLLAVMAIGIWRYEVLSGDLQEARKQLSAAQEANKQNQVVIEYQAWSIEQYRTYADGLAKANQKAAERAAKAIKQFEDMKREDPVVHDWADQPLPAGLLKP